MDLLYPTPFSKFSWHQEILMSCGFAVTFSYIILALLRYLTKKVPGTVRINAIVVCFSSTWCAQMIFFKKLLLLKLLQRNHAQNHSECFILLLSKNSPFHHESVQRIRQAIADVLMISAQAIRTFFPCITTFAFFIYFTVPVSFWMRKMWNSVLCKFNCNMVKSP